jgi:hypothetical protein
MSVRALNRIESGASSQRVGGSRSPNAEPSARGVIAAVHVARASPHSLVIRLTGKTIVSPYRPVSWDGTHIRKYQIKDTPA